MAEAPQQKGHSKPQHRDIRRIPGTMFTLSIPAWILWVKTHATAPNMRAHLCIQSKRCELMLFENHFALWFIQPLLFLFDVAPLLELHNHNEPTRRRSYTTQFPMSSPLFFDNAVRRANGNSQHWKLYCYICAERGNKGTPTLTRM